jgi:hypothetical protein
MKMKGELAMAEDMRGWLNEWKEWEMGQKRRGQNSGKEDYVGLLHLTQFPPTISFHVPFHNTVSPF